MYILKNVAIYHKLLKLLNVSGEVHVSNIEIATDLKSYARLNRGLDLSYSEINGNILVTISK